MHPVLKHNLYFIKEHTGLFKAANNFDIYDPAKEDLIMKCREESLGIFARMFRFTKYKKMTPFNIVITTAAGERVLTVRRGVSLFLSTVEVLDEYDNLVGKFKQKFFSIGGKFKVVDAEDNHMCSLEGKWTSWNFRFVKDGKEYAQVSKKWAGIGKELFTTADNYMLEINAEVSPSDPLRLMILASVMSIDMVLKE